MKKNILTIVSIIFILLCPKSAFGQEGDLIKTIKSRKYVSNYYQNKDSSVTVKTISKRGFTEVRNYSDLNEKVEDGKWTKYFPYSSINSICYFDKGTPTGIWKYYFRNGKIIDSVNYDFPLDYFQKDTLNYQLKKIDLQKNDSSNTHVDRMPLFNGGDINTFRSYCQSRIKLNEYMFEKYSNAGIQKILVQFEINTDGSIIDPKVENINKKLLEKEALRVIRQSPIWIPAYKKDKPVKVQFTFPIVFVFPK